MGIFIVQYAGKLFGGFRAVPIKLFPDQGCQTGDEECLVVVQFLL